MNRKKIYNAYDNGRLIATGSSQEVSARFAIPKRVIFNYAANGFLYRGQHKFEESRFLNERAVADKRLAWEWDGVRLRILATGRCQFGKCKAIKPK